MTQRPPPVKPVRIAGPCGQLEALIELPSAAPTRLAVICHPHPLHGGTLHNKVVHTLARTLQGRGAVALRFNYRGVGASEGAYDEGRGETEDALAVIGYARSRWPGLPLVIAGFSFGANVALRAAQLSAPAWLISVAPAVSLLLGPVRAPDCPWLILQGDADEIVDVAQVRHWVGQLAPAAQLRVLPGVGHFFHGRLNELAALVSGADPASA